MDPSKRAKRTVKISHVDNTVIVPQTSSLIGASILYLKRKKYANKTTESNIHDDNFEQIVPPAKKQKLENELRLEDKIQTNKNIFQTNEDNLEKSDDKRQTNKDQINEELQHLEDKLQIHENKLQNNENKLQTNKRHRNEDKLLINVDKLQTNEDKLQTNEDKLQINNDKLQANNKPQTNIDELQKNEDKLQTKDNKLQINTDELQTIEDELKTKEETQKLNEIKNNISDDLKFQKKHVESEFTIKKIDDKALEDKQKVVKPRGRKRDAKEYIVEVTEGVLTKKLIIADRKAGCQYGIDWNKYFIKNEESVSQRHDCHKKKKKKQKISPNQPSTSKNYPKIEKEILESSENTSSTTNEDISLHKTLESINIKPEIPSGNPKLPNERKNRIIPKKIQPKNEPKHKIIERFQNDDEHQIQIKIETPDAPANKTKQSMNKTLMSFFEDQKLTYRVIKRVNFIVKMVKQHKVIVDTMKIVKAIRDEESKEGPSVVIDKKSIIRLLLKLSEYGLIKYRKATLKSESTEKNITFICDINVADEDDVITSVLEQSKMKFFIMTKDKIDEQNKIKLKNEIEPQNIDENTLLNESDEEIRPDTQSEVVYKYNRTVSKQYGLRPKFARCRILHELIFYIIYGNQSEPITETGKLDKIFQEYGGTYKVFENSNPAPVYNREISWKMFIPPLARYTSWQLGWIILSDILLRLPLYVLVSCFNIPYEIPNIDEYLSHPIKKNFLIKNLPPSIRNGLMYGKKLTHSLFENLKNLCYIGLVQFGPQKFKEKEQLFIYLNRRASLYNTVTSTAGYIHISDDVEYEKINYLFNEFKDIEQYWYDMWSICVNTPLGYRSSVSGEYIIIENAWTKPALINSVKSHSQNEVEENDNGEIPGDHKGAAGFDSSLYAHMKRNWNWINAIPCSTENKIVKNKKDKSPKKIEDVIVKKEEIKTKPKKFKIRPLVRKEKIRMIKPKKTKRKRADYDEKDKLCLTRMRKLRTDWLEVEDHVLLLCAVASTYLCPNYRKQRIEQFVFRDILHRMVPCANDKTSRAVHRRIRYIMKNTKTRKSVFMCLEEIKHCEYVTEKFGTIVKKFQNSIIPELTLNIAFTELVSYLNLKFAKQIPKKTSPINIPDTIPEMHEKYDLIISHKKSNQTIKDINVYDIECDTIRSVIHSSLCSTKDKTSWAFQLFKIYQQYPESLLRQVINKIRVDKMASMKKTGFVKTRANTTSSMLQSPFKLSMYYIYQLQNTKFSFKSLTEANSFFLHFMQWINSDNYNGAYDITCSDHGTSLIIENTLRKLNLEIVFEHPEQVIILDPVIKEDKTYERILKKYYNILKAQNNINIEENNSDEENIPHIEFEQQSLNTEIKNPSRIGFHMMRADMFDHNEKNNVQHMHDYFVVQASKMYLKPLNLNSIIQYEKDSKQLVNNVINDIKSSILIPDSCNKVNSNEIKAHFYNLNITTSDLEYIEKIKCHIRLAKEFGLTYEELKNITPDSKSTILSLKNILELLTKFHIILRVGISCIRFVHFDYKKPWLTHADKILRLEKEKMPKDLIPSKWKGKHILKQEEQKKDRKLKILVAPWVRLDGSINRRVLDRWLGTFISICVEEPGMKLHDIIVRNIFLKATETIFLIEQLVKIDCVRLIKVKKPKITLFSDMLDYDFEETNILDNPLDVLIEPTEDAFFNFSVFLGAKTYNTNFVD